MNHCRNACFVSRIYAIPEREEGIGCHDGTGHLQVFVSGLDTGDFGRIYPAHLAGADTNGHGVLHIDNGIGFDKLGHLPGKLQVAQFIFCGLAFADHFQITFFYHAQVTILHQQAAVNAFKVQRRQAFTPLAAFQYAHIGLGGKGGFGRIAHGRGDNHFHKLAFDNLAGQLVIQCAVKGDNAAEGGGGVGFIGQLVGAVNIIGNGHAAGVGVLDDHTGRLVK